MPPTPNKFVKQIPPYSFPGSLACINMNKAALKNVFKLDMNECTISPSPRVRKTLISFLNQMNHLNWYPGDGAELKKAISEHAKLPEEDILLTNGSDSGLQLICDTFLAEKDEVLVPIPTFGKFKSFPPSRGAKIVAIPYDIGHPISLQTLKKESSRRTKMIYFVNPYIVTCPCSFFEDIAAHFPDALIVIDEAYADFLGKYCTSLVPSFPNVVIVRTFSKSFGLAGLRLGYILGSGQVMKSLSMMNNPVSVNVLAQKAGIEVLKDVKYHENYLKEIAKSKKLIMDALPKLGFEVIPTDSGFVLFRNVYMDASKVKAVLEGAGVFTRPFHGQNPLHQYLRMNLCTESQTRELLRIFSHLFLDKAVPKSI